MYLEKPRFHSTSFNRKAESFLLAALALTLKRHFIELPCWARRTDTCSEFFERDDSVSSQRFGQAHMQPTLKHGLIAFRLAKSTARLGRGRAENKSDRQKDC